MSDPIHSVIHDDATPWSKHRFIGLIVGAIGISVAMVSMSLVLYGISGTAQLDASRPGYKSVQSQVRKEEVYEGLSASGKVDANTLDEFRKLFDAQAKDATAVDAFSGEGLADDILNIDAPVPTPDQQ